LLTLLTTVLIFLISLAVVMSAAAWFTRRLEVLCDRLDFSPGVLSALSALGANIPNYVASIDALARAQTDVGLGIIIGSNIYNVAIILGIATFAAPGRAGIHMQSAESRDARTVGSYAVMVMLSTLLLVWLLPGMPVARANTPALFGSVLPVFIPLVSLSLFTALMLHIARRSHVPHAQKEEQDAQTSQTRTPDAHQERFYISPDPSTPFHGGSFSLIRLGAEIVLALVLALIGVIAMVQSGQTVTIDLHMPGLLAGLLVLAVATSLPNTVVVVILARTGRAVTCIEEIFSSNSINAALGIALPLLFWRAAQVDRLLRILDAPLMVALVLAVLLCVWSGKLSRVGGVLLLLSYAGWVAVHLWW